MKKLDLIKISLKAIKSQKQYREYLKIIDSLVDCRGGSPEEEVLELISILVSDYESKKYPIEPPDPIDSIKIKISEQGLKRKDLAKYFGSSSRVSEILNRKRPMTIEMIRKIHKGLKIPADTLIA